MAGASGGVGLLLLVEAEMSRPMYEIDTGDSNAEEAAKKHNCISTKGIGQEVPHKSKDASCIHKDLKGVQMVSTACTHSSCLRLTVNRLMASLHPTLITKEAICNITNIFRTTSII